jgi:hypothetical protein
MGNPLLAVPETTPIPVLLNAKDLGNGAWALQVSDSNSAPASAGTPGAASIGISSSQILADNASRKGATVYNTSAAASIFLTLGATSSLTVFTVKLVPGAYYETPFGYTGAISAISNVAGTVTVTEFA